VERWKGESSLPRLRILELLAGFWPITSTTKQPHVLLSISSSHIALSREAKFSMQPPPKLVSSLQTWKCDRAKTTSLIFCFDLWTEKADRLRRDIHTRLVHAQPTVRSRLRPDGVVQDRPPCTDCFDADLLSLLSSSGTRQSFALVKRGHHEQRHD
jgi:hypothetical protein